MSTVTPYPPSASEHAARPSTTGPAPGSQQVPSILILTKDEEINIEDCLRCFEFSDDVVVLDSFSSDRTLEIARRFPNVRVIQRKFDTWSSHSNWALRNIQFKHPWVYYSDADERVPPELRDEILSKINDLTLPYAAYRLRYKNMFMDRWIRFGGVYPVWILRLFRPEKVHYEEREVNAHPVVSGEVGELNEDFIHYSFNKGLVPWFHKHNSYSQMESHEAMRVLSTSLREHLRHAFSRNKLIRRRAIKNLSFYLPMRGFVRFLYMYILRLGFLDGSAGFHYAAMISMYEYWIELKVREHKHQWRKQTDDLSAHLVESRGALRVQNPPAEPGALEFDAAGQSKPSAPGSAGANDVGMTKEANPLIEVLIPTFNEAAHIQQAVASALAVGPVFVLDSCSTDGTQELARQAGATVIEHAFEGYARQKNWGLDNLPFKGDWVFILDADERITGPLRDEVLRAAKSSSTTMGYFVNRIVIFMGKQIRHGGLYPSWNLRFFRRGKCRYEDRAVHEHMVCDGPTEYLKHEMLHIRRETMTEYIRKHIQYADLESSEWVKVRTGAGGGARPSKMFRDVLRYRQWLRRRIWPRTPCRPLLRFMYMYFVRFGFLDGRAGYQLAQLMASYEYMISLLYRDKLARIRHQQKRELRNAVPRSPV